MYTGTLIEQLIESVREAEAHTMEARITEARRPAGAGYSTFIYEFKRREESIGVA